MKNRHLHAINSGRKALVSSFADVRPARSPRFVAARAGIIFAVVLAVSIYFTCKGGSP